MSRTAMLSWALSAMTASPLGVLLDRQLAIAWKEGRFREAAPEGDVNPLQRTARRTWEQRDRSEKGVVDLRCHTGEQKERLRLIACGAPVVGPREFETSR
jgi:hypothetical protein